MDRTNSSIDTVFEQTQKEMGQIEQEETVEENEEIPKVFVNSSMQVKYLRNCIASLRTSITHLEDFALALQLQEQVKVPFNKRINICTLPEDGGKVEEKEEKKGKKKVKNRTVIRSRPKSPLTENEDGISKSTEER